MIGVGGAWSRPTADRVDLLTGLIEGRATSNRRDPDGGGWTPTWVHQNAPAVSPVSLPGSDVRRDTAVRPALLRLPEPGRQSRNPSGNCPDRPVPLGEHDVHQLRQRRPVGHYGAQRARHTLAGYPRPRVQAQHPACGAHVVQPFDRGLLGQPALPAGPRRPELGAGGGEPLRGFGQPRGPGGSSPDGGTVKDEQLTTEPFHPVPGLCSGVVELTAQQSANRQCDGPQDNGEQERNDQDRGQQHGGHRIRRYARADPLAGVRTWSLIVCSTTAGGPGNWLATAEYTASEQ